MQSQLLSQLGPLLRLLPNKGKERLLRPLLRNASTVEARIDSFRMRLDLHDYIQRSVYLGSYEHEERRICRSILRRADAVINAGANCGGFTAGFCHQVGEEGLVVAIEPSPRMQRRLVEFQARNNVPQLELHQLGLSDARSEMDLYLPPAESGNDDAVMMKMEGYEPVKVPVTTLDLLAGSYSRSFRLMKIDVEGHEPRVLKGGRDLLGGGRVEFLLMEFNSYFLKAGGSSSDGLFDLALELGFESTTPRPNFMESGLETLLFRHKSFTGQS